MWTFLRLAQQFEVLLAFEFILFVCFGPAFYGGHSTIGAYQILQLEKKRIQSSFSADLIVMILLLLAPEPQVRTVEELE